MLDRWKMASAARDTMALLDFHVSRTDAPVSNFSGGQRQAVAIGRAVDWSAGLFLMDEAPALLGVPEPRTVMSRVQELEAQGRWVIFISHDLEDIFAVCDRIVVFRLGVDAGFATICATRQDDVVTLMVGG